jgi:hypothetical protein
VVLLSQYIRRAAITGRTDTIEAGNCHPMSQPPGGQLDEHPPPAPLTTFERVLCSEGVSKRTAAIKLALRANG